MRIVLTQLKVLAQRYTNSDLSIFVPKEIPQISFFSHTSVTSQTCNQRMEKYLYLWLHSGVSSPRTNLRVKEVASGA